ncbi:hypothetical protein [Streptosporangium lutulentum]|uniref:Uncharacterized protein n=1 Tax=Streptosporangium lutulentum TaxID=1461250 RepID=A0ABT9Q3B0_9ACTN|nr:hypothetical protein [Streptosporangium lutulentum]MDP9841231.1 hypothetical protein [Streptosporangium lutulentum]
MRSAESATPPGRSAALAVRPGRATRVSGPGRLRKAWALGG